MASSSNSPCAACKFLRRKCTQGCVFAPYFPPDNPQKFSSVHRVFGASNVAKLLNELPSHQREDAVNSLAYEADSRLRDPVYGCVGYISILQGKLRQIQHELENAKKELSTYIGPAAYGPILPPYQSQFAVGGVPFHHQNQYHHPSVLSGSSSSSMNPFGGPGIGMGLGLTAANSQMLIREQQQAQQMAAEAQKLAVAAAAAAAAAREQEMLRSLEQQQQYSGGFVNVSDGRAGYNQMAGGSISCVSNSVVVGGGGGGGGGGGSSPLVMHSQQQFGNQFQVQQQQQHQLLDLHQYSDQNDETASGVGVGQHQIRAKSEEGGMTSAVDILKFN